jgi:hypothetical protein
MQKYLLLISLLLTSLYAQKSNTEILGDIFLLTLPLGTYGTTLYLEDDDGQIEFYKSLGTTLAVTYTLKYSVKEERPNHEDNLSFPSGHSSTTFASASFIHMRYGFKYAILPYLAAIYTGYSRVDSQQHYTSDVVAGALIGIASSWLFTSSYKNVKLQALSKNDYRGVSLSYKW